jgi:hypothetical protein
MADRVVHSVPRGTRTIEATGKRWKAWRLVGSLGVATGIALLVCGITEAGFFVLVPSLIVCLGARFGAWWHHG